MPRCVIINCNRPNIPGTQTQGHISYHSFPHNPFVKEKWIAATGRKDWFPTKHSTICSIHFEDTSFIQGKKLRLLKKTAYPTIDILKFVENDDENKDNPQQPLSLLRKIKQEKNTIEPPTSDDDDNIPKHTPKEKRLLNQLHSARQVIKEKDKQIKRLREQNRRKEEKILAIMTVLTSLKKKIMKQANSQQKADITMSETLERNA